MAASNITYTAAAGATLYAGRFKPVAAGLTFDSVAIAANFSPLPAAVQNQIPVMSLHQSGGQNYTAGRQFTAAVSGRLAYEEHVEFKFRTTGSTSGAFNGNQAMTYIRPNSYYGNYPGGGIRQGWSGFVFRESPFYNMITARRLDALYHWMETTLASEGNPESVDLSKLCLTGGSMGAWGTMHYGLRRPGRFAALYADRPRVRWDDVVGGVDYSKYDTGGVNGSMSDNPTIDPADGGGTVAELHDAIAYVSNPNNFVPWIGWNVGETDGFTPFSDHIEMIAAMRAAGRPFAMAWNRGDHTTGQIMSKITASYPFGTFQLGKGYPHFTNHSLDVEPTVDDGLGAGSTQATEGGINLGLAFRSVVETANGWACEVTSTIGPCTVDVRPYASPVFKATVAPINVVIPAAKTWVAVSFTA